MKFEEAIKKLEEIVDALEQGNVPLDDCLKLYEEGQKLIKFCRDTLTKVETKVKELVKNEKGEFELKPLKTPHQDET